MNEENNWLYRIALSQIKGVGSVTAKKLIAYTGSAEAALKEKKKNLLKIPGIGERAVRLISDAQTLKRAEEELKFIEKYNIKAFFYTDKEYPYRLKQCDDGPLIFYAKGEIDYNADKIISIVGTRNATDYGKSVCENLIKEMKERNHNPIIVSGLAYGIDVCAHRAALKNDLRTIAVFAHGLDTIYPSIHNNTAKEIVKNNGSLISEFLSNTQIDRNYFLQRNRIIAGLADATLIVESAKKGGALVTAEIANSYSREVFAIPGKVSDTYSKGCNFLIKKNKAILTESVDDIEYFLNWDIKNSKNKAKQTELFIELTKDEQELIHFLKENGKTSIDIICRSLQKPVNQISTLLLELEFKNMIKNFPGSIYDLVIR